MGLKDAPSNHWNQTDIVPFCEVVRIDQPDALHRNETCPPVAGWGHMRVEIEPWRGWFSPVSVSMRLVKLEAAKLKC